MPTTKSSRRKPSAKQVAERKAQAEALQSGMVEQIKSLTNSKEWRKFLASSAAFHDYSFHNVMMILSQNYEATKVAGFRSWQNRGRQVRKGERALKIFGYRTFKKTETDEKTGEKVEKQYATFPLLSVFDISQTDPIDGAVPEISQRLLGSDPDDIYGRCTDFLIARGWTVSREDIPGETNGLTYLDGSYRVLVDAGLSDAQAAKSLLHEAAHVLLHAGEDGHGDAEATAHLGTGEVEAESVAYTVAGLLGIDTSRYSVGYIAGWGQGDLDTIQKAAQRVLGAVHTLADSLLPSDTAEQVEVA